MSKNNKLFFPFLLLSLILGSCSVTNTDFTAEGDTVFIKKTIDDQEVYAVSYYAYGSSSLSFANVTTPLAETVQLEPYSSNTYIYYLDPDSTDFTTSYPTEGTYTFEITNDDGEIYTTTDDQELADIGIAELDTMKYDSDYDGYYITWNVVSDADAYAVYLYDEDDEPIFISYSVDVDAPEYILLYGYYGTWDDAPEEDETYTLRIKSIKYDADATSSDYIHNIQEISYNDFTFVWGEEN